MLFLDELLEFLEGKEGLYVEFEMKTHPAALYPEERLARYCDELYRMVKAAEPADAQFVFTSSDYRALRYMQMNHPDAELMLITGKPCCDETIDFSKAVGIKRLSCTMDGTSRKAVKRAHKEGADRHPVAGPVGRGFHARRLSGLRPDVHRRAHPRQELAGGERPHHQGEILSGHVPPPDTRPEPPKGSGFRLPANGRRTGRKKMKGNRKESDAGVCKTEKKRYFCSSLPARGIPEKGESRRHGRTIIHDIRELT